MNDLTEKRLKELYERSYQRGYNVFSEFLNIDEQSVLSSLRLPAVKYGGYPLAERVVAGFGDYIENTVFPISCVCVTPVNEKFADSLTHRDFLGCVMNTGIKRELIGDIVIKDNKGYIFCLEQIAEYLCDKLTRIKHTTVSASLVTEIPEALYEKPESREYIVSSLRLDVIISAVYKLSRSEASSLFDKEKVFVNSRQCTNASYSVKDNDIISVRGYGRIEFVSLLRKTKKDRLVVEVIKYQ